MTKEQEKAINNLKQYIKDDKTCNSERKDLKDFDKFYINHCIDIETVLELIKSQQKQIDKQSEIIDDMAECLAYYTSTPLREKYYCFKSMQCEIVGGSKRCPDCIKEYFERKVEDKYELFKATYMQNPSTLLTEGNLDKLAEHCKKASNYERGIEHKITLELLYRYDELKSERTKLIEKLEEDINKFKEQNADGSLQDYLEEILQLLKGE